MLTRVELGRQSVPVRGLLVALGAIVSAVALAQPSGAGTDQHPAFRAASGQRFVSAECPVRFPVGLQVDCGELVVPEDRARPRGTKVRLPFAVVRTRSSTPRPDPIVFIVGGPAINEINPVTAEPAGRTSFCPRPRHRPLQPAWRRLREPAARMPRVRRRSCRGVPPRGGSRAMAGGGPRLPATAGPVRREARCVHRRAGRRRPRCPPKGPARCRQLERLRPLGRRPDRPDSDAPPSRGDPQRDPRLAPGHHLQAAWTRRVAQRGPGAREGVRSAPPRLFATRPIPVYDRVFIGAFMP